MLLLYIISERTPSLDSCAGRSAHAEEGIPWSQEVLQEGGLHLTKQPLQHGQLGPQPCRLFETKAGWPHVASPRMASKRNRMPMWRHSRLTSSTAMNAAGLKTTCPQRETEISSVLGLAKDGDELLLMAPSENNWFVPTIAGNLGAQGSSCLISLWVDVRKYMVSTCCMHRGSIMAIRVKPKF